MSLSGKKYLEIVSLVRFALDWQPGSNKMQVLYGNVMCELVVPPGYPDTGQIVLNTVKGSTFNDINASPQVRIIYIQMLIILSC